MRTRTGSGRGLVVRVLDSGRSWVRSPHWAWFAFEVRQLNLPLICSLRQDICLTVVVVSVFQWMFSIHPVYYK